MSNASLLTRIPTNTSFLQSNKFTLVFPTMPFLRYFAQNATIPSISTNAVTQASPYAAIKRHGDTLTYESFTITTLVDEDLKVYEETHDWMVAMTKPQAYEQYKRFYDHNKKLYHDAVLTVNTNANNPNLRFTLKNCHPVTVGQINLDLRKTADDIVTVDIVFQYDYFEMDRL